jgi:hypothetical protein
MKAMLHGLPEPFITINGHYEVGTVFTWVDDSKYYVHKCDPIGENPESQLQNVYVKKEESQ